jgi:LDH2 family malate/lactate/ureidoglycolate dehydrogenase
MQFETLVATCTEILTSLGVPPCDAQLVADSLVTSDAWGHPSHGVLRLGWYAARLRSGVINAASETELVVDGGAVCVLDGLDGVGQVVTRRASDLAVERAKDHGVGVVAVRHSNHFGTAAYFTRGIAAEGCAAILTTNGSPAMAPWGGTEKTVGANPWSLAVPGGTHGPVVLDIANTVVARGKVYAALERGEQIPHDWAITSDGARTTDPREAIAGLILPMAGHKGYAISLMMDVFSGVLTGSSFATDVTGPYVPDRRSGCGHLIVAIDIAALRPRADFDRDLQSLLATTKSVALAEGHDEIYYPGELEDRRLAAAKKSGVAVPAKTLEELDRLAVSCGVEPVGRQ